MDMNKAFFARKEQHEPQWRLIDAAGKVVGRLACEIADALRGKDKPTFTPHADVGDYIVVINAEKVVFTGDKLSGKEYIWYTQWIGGQKSISAKEMMLKDPTYALTHAVKGMLGSTKLARAQMKKLRVYAGEEHRHIGQLTGRLAKK